MVRFPFTYHNCAATIAGTGLAVDINQQCNQVLKRQLGSVLGTIIPDEIVRMIFRSNQPQKCFGVFKRRPGESV
jgi:hypothetical protein